MKNALVILFCFGAFGYSQNSIIDSIPLKLIPEPVAISIQPWTQPWPQEPWRPYEPWPQPWPIDWAITTSWLVYMPGCGDSYHENGQLSSRIECVDSVMHGKAIYWDETGHKTSESTYADGHVIKSKTYDSRGRLESLYHYDYKGNYHGTCISTDLANEMKTITHYDHGAKQGALEEYEYGFLVKKEIYNHDVLKERFNYGYQSEILESHEIYSGQRLVETREYAANGQMIKLDKSDTLGSSTIHREWTSTGILLVERIVVDYKPVGTHLEYYDTLNDIKKLTIYENGVIIKGEEYQGNFLQTEQIYDNGTFLHTVSWFENGDSAYFYKPGLVNFQKKWNDKGAVAHEYSYTYPWLFVGNAYYTSNDTVYHIVSTEKPGEYIPVIRWVVYHGDTVRMDYVRNNSNIVNDRYLAILASNKFVYDAASDKWVKHGIWKSYLDNNLQAAITYNHGKKNGRAATYSIPADTSVLAAIGNYVNDLKQGEWITYSDTTKTVENYVDGLLEGEVRTYDTLGNPVSKITYLNNERHGHAVVFHDASKTAGQVVKSNENYEHGKLHGLAVYSDEQNRIILRGEYENGVRVKTWLQYTYEADGTVKRTKIHYKNAEPAV